MDKQYYFSQNGHQFGPMSFGDLFNHPVTPETLFWYQGLPDWQKGSALPELVSLFQRVPPPIDENLLTQPSPTFSVPPPIFQNKPSQSTLPAYEWYLGVWKKYAQFSGRARRSEYWYFILFHSIASIVLALFSDNFRGGALGLIYSLYLLAAFIPSLSVGVRRMHDVGKSGWFLLIPFYNLILACTDGERGSNIFGADPKHV